MNREPAIAVVGMGGIFPGATDLAAFWRNIVAGVDTTRDVPAHRWILDRSRALADGPAPDRVYSLRGCFVDDFVLDPAGLNIDKDLLAALDPLYHLVLHAGRTAFADAATSELDRRRVGVILAAIALPTDASSAITREILGQAFQERLLQQPGIAAELRTHPLNSRVTGLPAALLAQALQLGGGSYTLDAACASSLYALKLACDELREGRADAMLAGGVSRPECLYTQMGFSQLRALSASGRCAPFDASCDGLVVGEGAGVVMLKRLDDALRDGDRVYGVIRGIGLSNDIGGSLLAPDSEGQLRAMREAYGEAGWSPDDIDLIECHGTGTPTGDAVEIGSLRTLWQGLQGTAARCPIGSVKSMIGHLLTGAGAAGLIKVLLAMREQTLPPSANYKDGGRVIPMEGSPFRVQTSPAPWQRRDDAPRRAAISAFGFGGINAHVLMEEFVQGKPVSQRSPGIAIPGLRQDSQQIAIVGMATHFGAARSLRQLQETMFGGGETVHERPNSRWEGSDDIARRMIGERGARGAYLDGWSVPVGKYRLPPTEIPEVLPQQMLMMEVVAAALEDARLPLRERRPRVGAIIGMALDFGTTNFHLRWWIEGRARHWAEQLGLDLDDGELERWMVALKDAAGPALNAARTVGALGGMIASRIAREFQLGGPSYAVSCDEASGLRAVEIAARALARNEIDAAIVGAVDLAGDVRNVVTTTLLKRLNKGGEVHDEMIGEGAAAVVLKRLDDARAAGDRIYAVICGAGAADDPSAHDFSSKMTLGHTGAAEGMASLVQAALCLYHGILPPNIGSDSSSYWWRDRIDGPRRAAAEATTLDGKCVRVILEEADQTASASNPSLASTSSQDALFAIEADDVNGLLAGIDELLTFAAQRPQDIVGLARQWFQHRGIRRNRRLAACLVAASMQELTDALSTARSALSSKPDQPLDGRMGAFYSPAPLGGTGPLAFVFPGSGNHFPEMGRDIALRWPEMVRLLDRESQRLRSQMIDGQAPSGESDGDADVHRTIFRQVSYCMMMSDLLRRLGIEPQSVIGYSLGESAGLFALRAWRDRDEMLQRMSRSPLFKTDLAGPCRAIRAAWNIPDDQSVDWTAAIVGRPVEAVREALDGLKHARLLIINTPKECVIGGLRTDVATVARRLRCRAVPLDGVPTVHFEAVRQVEEAYRELHLLPTTPPDGVRFYSAAAGRAYDVTRASAAESITAQALHGFDFPALIRQAYADGVRLFVEVGPQASCTRMIGKILAREPHFARSASARGEEEIHGIFQLAAALIAERVPIDVSFLLGAEESEAVLTKSPSPQPSPSKGEGVKTVFVEVGRLPSTPPLPARRGREPRLQEAPPRRILEPAALSTVLYEDDSLTAEWARTTEAAASAHRAFLRFSETATEGMASVLAFQTRVLETMVASDMGSVALADLFADQSRDCKGAPSGPSNVAQRSLTVAALNRAALNEPALSRELCLEFARGSAAKVLGPEFAEVDGYPTRVRLPDEPLMLVDRIMEIEGVKGSLTGGRVVTEHDVFADAWYLDGGRAPICITVEAGQADLFLSAYLGIDRITKGVRTYRLLDATVTFHRGLPRPGETIRYDIRIEKFVRQGETHLFFFQFDGTIDGVPVLTMRNGCAGFFTPEEIRNSRGIVLTPEELAPVKGKPPADWRLPTPMSVESYGDANLAALRRGDLAGCFGPMFAGLPITDPLRLPGGRMKLIDRVTQLDPTDGRYGLGLIRAEADIHPDDWFLTCHFVDDMVMPGTLMYECCAHTLRMFLLRMGWVGEQNDVCYEPVPGVVSSLRCRGPVTPKTKTVTYQVEIKEIGYRPEPYVLADAMMYADGEAIVRMTNMSLQMTGTTRERIEGIWARRRESVEISPEGATDPSQGRKPLVNDLSGAQAPEGRQKSTEPVDSRPAKTQRTIFSREQILAFCIGNPSDCFGEPYRIFNNERKCARLPGPPYCFLDCVTSVEPEPFVLQPGGWIECEYDVPPDAWYFAANRQPSMPYAVLLEIALQPCGFLAAYAGSALTSQTDLSFRNLGGTATLNEEIFANSGTLRTRVRMTDVSRAGGMIIEQFDMVVWRGDRIIFDGKTSFGFFSKASLAQQVGIRDAKQRLYVPTTGERSAAKHFALPDDRPFMPDEADNCPAVENPQSAIRNPQSAQLPARALRMIDQIDILLPNGGPHGLGFIQGSALVDPEAWFFKAHFYQDPVWPGSLGLESFLQLLKVYALDRWPDLAATHRFEPIAVGTPHTWAYRGQIIPTNRRVEVQAVLTRREDGSTPTLVANGLLSIDGITIYEMLDFGLRLRENGE